MVVGYDGSKTSRMGLVLREGINAVRGRNHVEAINPQPHLQELLQHEIVIHTQDAEKRIGGCPMGITGVNFLSGY